MKHKRYVPLLVFAGLALMLGVGLKLNPREVPSPLIGKPAPPLLLPALAAAQPALAGAEMLGQVWVLNVWASWCAPCRDEHPLLVQAAQQGDVPLVGLNYKDDPRAAQEWLLRLGNPYAATGSDRDGRASINWGVYGVPETFVIDKTGVVRFKHVGPLNEQVWRDRVLPLVRQLQG